MTFDNLIYGNNFQEAIVLATKYVLDNEVESLKNLLARYPFIGSKNKYEWGYPTPLYHDAIVKGYDDITLLLYQSDPTGIKYSHVSNRFNDFTICTDILGDAVINKRYELVRCLLELEGIYKFDIDGIRITNNLYKNCYYISKSPYGDFNDTVEKYVSSPLMLSILTDNYEMYKLFKTKGAYFDKDNKNCIFHLENCNNEKILEDIYGKGNVNEY